MPYPTGPFTHDYTVGNYADGTEFQDTKAFDGQLVKSITAWFGGPNFNAIQYTFTKGDTITHGSPNGEKATFFFEAGEYVTSLQLSKYWGGRAKGNIARIWFRTSLGKIFAIGQSTDVDLYSPDVGSGYLAGFTGSGPGSFLYSLGCIFLIHVQKVVLNNVIYPQLPASTENIDKGSVSSHLCNNAGYDSPSPCEWTEKLNRTDTITFSSSTTRQFTEKLTIEAKIPLLETTGVESSWGLSSTSTHSYSESTTQEFIFSRAVTTAPGEVLRIEGWLTSGNLDIDYVADVIITFPDNQTLQYKEEGKFQNALFANAETKVVKLQSLPSPLGARVTRVSDDESDDDGDLTEKEMMGLQMAKRDGRQPAFWRRVLSCGFRSN
ncbi:MAG: hypothetical protein Q9217_006609 [Psora testacea]